VEDGQLSNPYIFYVYVFNPATGGVMYTGGQISAPSAVEAVVTALRQWRANITSARVSENRVKEAEEETLRREVLEETGLRVSGQQLRMR
jgi:8-oxo-dGTP pyrophosphatase MutT (NUDIX family)